MSSGRMMSCPRPFHRISHRRPRMRGIVAIRRISHRRSSHNWLMQMLSNLIHHEAHLWHNRRMLVIPGS